MLALLAVAASNCVLGTAPYTAPRATCTPGAYHRMGPAEACTSKDRPYLPAAERRKILARYRLTAWTGRDGELDHRVPFFLGGTTDARNIWPESGSIPNPKDKLEFYVYRRVCRAKTMTVRYARRIFLTDWRPWYGRYVMGPGRAAAPSP